MAHPLLKIVLGLLFCFLGLGYLYRPDIIARLNVLLRQFLFNDAHIALERRKWGALSVMVGIILIYMGLSAWK